MHKGTLGILWHFQQKSYLRPLYLRRGIPYLFQIKELRYLTKSQSDILQVKYSVSRNCAYFRWGDTYDAISSITLWIVMCTFIIKSPGGGFELGENGLTAQTLHQRMAMRTLHPSYLVPVRKHYIMNIHPWRHFEYWHIKLPLPLEAHLFSSSSSFCIFFSGVEVEGSD